MLWPLVRKELLSYLTTLRFGIALVFSVALIVLSTLFNSLDYSHRMEGHKRELVAIQDRLDRATVYQQVRPDAFPRPQPLSVFSRGVDSSVGSKMGVSVYFKITSPQWTGGIFDTNVMKVLLQIDFVAVVALLLSFLAVTLGFDSVCGEREQGTLKLLLLNSVPRGRIVLAKLLGGTLALALPFALGFAIGLLILLGNPAFSPTGEDWLRIGLLFALSCFFLSQIFSFSQLVSVLARDSATSLVVCLFAWVVGSVVFMNALPSLVRYSIGEDDPLQTYFDRAEEINRAANERIQAWEQRNPGPGEAYTRGHRQNGVLRYAHPEGYAWLAKYRAYQMEVAMDEAEKDYRALWDHQKPFARQALLVDELAILSPFTNYRHLTQQLAGTTIDDKFRLVRLTHRYREGFIAWLRGKDAFASRRWFSDDPPTQQPMIADPAAVSDDMLRPGSPFMQERTAWALAEDKKAADDPRRQLDLTGLPDRDAIRHRTLAESLDIMTPGLAVMVLTYGLSLLLTFYRFQRYELD